MTAIVTLTMNPALDVTTSTPAIEPTHKLRCAAPRYDPGGGGINVARTIIRLGGDALAIFPSGGATGAYLTRLMEGEAVPMQVIPIAGTTRESFAVTDERSSEQFRFVLPGPRLLVDERRACFEAVAAALPTPGWLVAGGSLPPGVGDAFYAELAGFCRTRGIRFVLDTSGPALAACRGANAFLIKPSATELSSLVGGPLESEKAELDAAQAIHSLGYAENVVVSLGARGALAVTANGHVRMPAPQISVRSGVGTGDAMLGAIVHKLARGAPMAAAVGYGIAAGAAAALSSGTQLMRPDDVDRLYAELALAGEYA
jgi:6-phosphofructokinase 2